MAKKASKNEHFGMSSDIPKTTPTVKRQFIGRWHIRSASEWSYDYLAMEQKPEIKISSSGCGTIRFGAFEGILDAMKDEFRPDDILQFSFHGSDEGDETYGRGVAHIENGIMKGRITFHRSMVSEFEAEKLPSDA